MAHRWFRTWGWIYRPISWQGWLAAGLTVLFCVQVFTAVDRSLSLRQRHALRSIPILCPSAHLVDLAGDAHQPPHLRFRAGWRTQLDGQPEILTVVMTRPQRVRGICFSSIEKQIPHGPAERDRS
jgi:hypothetical protein